MAGKGTTLQITPANVRYLAARGAHSHRGGGTFSRSVVLGRALETLRLYHQATDPRRSLPAPAHEILVRFIPEPWTLKAFEIENLHLRVRDAPGFLDAVAAAGLDPDALLAAVAALGMAEKITLVDQAVQAQGPAAAAASPEEP